MTVFVESLIENLADALTIAAVMAVIIGAAWFWLARKKHIARLRRKLHGGIALSNQMKETLAKVFNLDTAEVATIGTVTFVDIAWHYSMADPHIWDHFTGPAADHIGDAIQNLEVLQTSLGEAPLLNNVLEYFKSLEATQFFHDLLPGIDAAADSPGVVLDAHASPLVDSLSGASTALDVKAAAASKAAGLITHIPLVTIGFATYRAWRRSQQGTKLRRNAEFAAIEVAARTSGGLVGGQLGGALGTVIVPGVGTIIGGVAGAVAGAIGGALLGEEVKARHIRSAQTRLDASLVSLGRPYLTDPANFRQLNDVFTEHERQYISNLQENRRRARRYGLLPWRVIWPNEKMILLQETVAMAQERLADIKHGTIEAVERLRFMRETAQYKQMGILLWSDPALCEQVGCEGQIIGEVAEANARLRQELGQLARQPQGVSA